MIQALFNTPFEVKRKILVAEGGGSYTQTLSTVVTSKGKLLPVRQYEQLQYKMSGIEVTNRLYTYTSVDIREADIISIGGNNYEVVTLVDADFGLNQHKEVELKREK
jgi:hypothetical protein